MSPQSVPKGGSGPDVSQLSAETLATAAFPVSRATDFRVHFDPQAHAAMVAHAGEDVSFEICGVLVGDWGRDSDGPFVNVRNYIRCDSAEKKFAEVTFTHESWSHINREMDTKYQDQRIVGWYHSHPNFGIFLSDRDFFIQQNFFSGPGQIALVIDPVRKIEGVFEWRNGGTSPTPQYWVGSRLQLAPTGGDTEMPESGDSSDSASQGAIPAAPASPLGMATTLLAGLCLFLMGWMLSGWLAGAERRAIIEGTVAHYGLWKGLRPGLEEGLASVHGKLNRVSANVQTFSEDHVRRSADAVAVEKDEARRAELKKASDKLDEDWRKTRIAIADMGRELNHLQQLYSWTPEERDAVLRYVMQKQIELQALESKSRHAAPEPTNKKSATGDVEEQPKADSKQPAKR